MSTVPTTDFAVAVNRFVGLVDTLPGQCVAARKGRYLVWQAVYGDLWSPERVGEVPPEIRPALRAVASRIIRQVFPGGAYATAVTASQLRATLTEETGNR